MTNCNSLALVVETSLKLKAFALAIARPIEIIPVPLIIGGVAKVAGNVQLTKLVLYRLSGVPAPEAILLPTSILCVQI